MRKSLLFIGGAAVLALAACDGERSVRISRSESVTEDTPLRAVESLRCPEQQGALTRTATAADGLSCAYSGPRGAEVSLRLVRLADGQTAAEALAAIEDELKALMPETIARANAGGETRAAAEASGQAGSGERVDVRLPGLTVRTEGDRAVVRLPGITIDADESSSRVNVTGVTVQDGEGAEDVRVSAQGEDTVSITAHQEAAEIRTSRGRDAVRGTYILVDEQASAAGWRLVGYEARGPEGGPLVVAVVRSKNRREDQVFDAAKDLVTVNVGD